MYITVHFNYQDKCQSRVSVHSSLPTANMEQGVSIRTQSGVCWFDTEYNTLTYRIKDIDTDYLKRNQDSPIDRMLLEVVNLCQIEHISDEVNALIKL